jgi:hypothetical protein
MEINEYNVLYNLMEELICFFTRSDGTHVSSGKEPKFIFEFDPEVRKYVTEKYHLDSLAEL